MFISAAYVKSTKLNSNFGFGLCIYNDDIIYFQNEIAPNTDASTPSTSQDQNPSVKSNEEITFLNCKICSQMFSISSIRNHLAKMPSCKEKYTESELSDLKNMYDLHRRQQKQKSKSKCAQKKNDSPVNSNNSEVTSEEEILSTNCHGCTRLFYINVIQNHLAKVPSCKKKYSEENFLELEKMLDSHRKMVGRKRYKKNSAKQKKKQKISHFNHEQASFVCKNPYCKSKKGKNKFFNSTSLLRHLRDHEICEGYFTPSEIKSLEEKSKNVQMKPENGDIGFMNSESNKNVNIKMDIYYDACEMVKHCDLSTQTSFQNRLEEKDKICIRLHFAIYNVSKSYDDEVDWLNNLVIVENSLNDLIHHHTSEAREWWDIWTDELLKTILQFTNDSDVDDDIWDMKYDLR